MNVGELNAYLRLNSGQFTTGLATAQRKLGGFGGAAGAVFKTMAKVAAVAIGAMTAVIGKGIHDAAEFEQALANVSTMVRSNVGPTMEGFRKELLRVSKEFGEGTDTLAKGLYDILSASIPAEKAMTVLEVATMAAKAGMTETAVAADAITTMINSYGMAAEDAGYASDILFTTVVRGKTTFAELAPTIGKVATLGAEAGVSMKELGAMISIMTRRGIESQKATTFLRSAITELLKPSDEAVQTAKRLGIEFGAQALAAKGLTGVLDDLRGMPPDLLVKLFPNVRSLQAIITSTGEMNEEIDTFNQILAEGSPTMVAFQKNTDTVTYRFEQFKKTVKATSIEIGQRFLNGFDETMSKITTWLQGEGGERILNFFGNIAKAAADLIPKLFDFAAKARAFIQWFADATAPAWNAYSEFFTLLWEGLKNAVDLIFGFAGDSEKAFNMVQNVIKMMAANFLVWSRVGTFAITSIIDSVKNLIEIWKSAGETVVLIFQGKFKEAREAAKGIGQNIRDIGTDIADNWKDTLGKVPEELDKLFSSSNMSYEELKNTLSSLGPTAQKTSKQVVESFEYGSEGSKDHTDDVKTDSAERVKARTEEADQAIEDELMRLQIEEETRQRLREVEDETITEIDAIREAEQEKEYQRLIDLEAAQNIKRNQFLDAERTSIANLDTARDAAAEKDKRREEEKIDYIKELSKNLYKGLTDLISEHYQNQIDWIDYNLAVRKNALREQYGDSEEYEAAVIALEKQAAKDKYEIELKQFKTRKAESYINTIISTAGAIMKAFEQLGPIGGAIATGFLVALGAAKLAIISRQAPPPPPTFYRGGEVEAGVLRGRPGVDQNMIAATTGEYLMPPGQTAANINELEAMRRGEYRPSVSVQPGTVIVSLDGREIARATVPYLENEYDSGRARVNPRAVRAK